MPNDGMLSDKPTVDARRVRGEVADLLD
ncbi:hypothetical protein BAV0669A [Bordetella avium 197N]|uniref:Uncharacterized protein n=1 Tax=Bordetella avium (strain 197N) TaxID=360910 RepID=Q2KXF5_BORA1|nr:hypothetical protein BAV0669A [Bordetella avium 197N]